jgi:hypothetical protein
MRLCLMEAKILTKTLNICGAQAGSRAADLPERTSRRNARSTNDRSIKAINSSDFAMVTARPPRWFLANDRHWGSFSERTAQSRLLRPAFLEGPEPTW